MIHAGSGAGRRAGSALVFAVLTVGLLMMLGLTLTGLGTRASVELNALADDRCAFSLAEAGIGEALTAVRAARSGAIGSADAPAYLGHGLLWVEATPLASGGTRLVAKALKGSGRAALEVVVGPAPSFWARYPGIASLEALDVKTDGLFDSYDSSLGDYATQLRARGNGRVNENVGLSSNDDVSVGNHGEVWGSVHAGPGGSAGFGSGAFASGSTTPLPTPMALEPVSPPAIASSGSRTVSGTTTIGPGDVSYSDLTVAQRATLTIVGPARIVVSGDVDIRKSTISIDATRGDVELWIGGDLDSDTQATISTSGASARALSVLLYGDSSQVAHFQPQGAFKGTIYGPEALVEIGTGFEIFGAVAARRVEFQPHGALHYDEVLSEAELGGTAGALQILSWHPASRDDLPVSGRDPFELLGVEKHALPTPSEAWGD